MPSHRIGKDSPIPQRRRDGCTECRRKKVKCDLKKPICSRCTRFPKECKYDINIISQNVITYTRPGEANRHNESVNQSLNPIAHQPVLNLSPFLSSKESQFFMHIFHTETAPRLFPAAPALFLQRIIASSLETPHLLYALLASACSHHSRLVQDTGPKSRVSCLRFTNLSISSLRSALSETNATLTAETVTTAMALCTNDVCNGNMQTWRTHLGGVMRLLSAFLDTQGTSRIADPYIQCLIKWFTTMDVLAGLSGLSTSGVMSSDTGLLDRSFDLLSPHVDDICGYSLQLAPLLARLSQLVQRQSHTEPAMQQDILEESRRLEIEISSLVKCSVPGGDSLELQSTHLAFVHAALLHLHRRVQILPKNHETVKQDIRKVISAVEDIPPFSSTNILILWPMFSVGCETNDTRHREFIHKRMGDMQSLGMGNFTRARELLSKFWASETSLSWDIYFANLGLELVLF
ncbi:Fungal transcriptional regulatory protein, N-terminal [Penicillium camemberti]|uniref:Fungal transcriptional regulatory protein, N-terminal n=1 Tax=Penicillium camemberti (strain FM 013) TaxID=1429867 RepID=A0A0G4P6N1_PENC3|nr:Fungal transcriptional regulatory protein, N-terminal [Penicillium camemberti]